MSSSPSSSSSAPKCCCSCYWNGPNKPGIYFWCKPCRVLVNTFVNWWIPRICLFFCVIFYFVVTFGLKIGIHLSVYELNENISAREIMWHMVSICWSFFAGFYVLEWWKDDKRDRNDDINRDSIYDVSKMRGSEGGDNLNDADDNIFSSHRNEGGLVLHESDIP